MRMRRAVAAAGSLLVLGPLTMAATASGATNFFNEHITLLSTSASGSPQYAIGTGPIHARGTDVSVSSTMDVITFPKGTLDVTHKTGHSGSTFDKVTCYGTSWETGTYQVTGGTGAYKMATGHGTYRLNITFIGCSTTAPPQLFMLRIDGYGPLSIG